MKVKLDNGAYEPRRMHETDAGLDLFAREDKEIRACSTAVFDTGVHVQIPHGYCGMLISKSGLNVKHDIVSTGLIDEGYTGSICVKLYNLGFEKYTVHKGDKISQLVLVPCLYTNVELVDSLDASDRGDNGFGSTGR